MHQLKKKILNIPCDFNGSEHVCDGTTHRTNQNKKQFKFFKLWKKLNANQNQILASAKLSCKL